MAQPTIGEIRMFAGNFAPAGWAFCNGQIVPISENETLFNLIGTTYGGDGQETFAYPNLQSRVPIHMGQGSGLSNYVLAQTGGVETVNLTVNQIPIHTHALLATVNPGTQNQAANMLLAQSPTTNAFPYGTDLPSVQLDSSAITQIGGSQPHDNMQPYLCVNFIISLFGVFPSPT